jgi:hypothetical protein
MKKTMFLLTWTAIRTQTQWAVLYHRLVPRLCSFDERTQAYRGKGKVFGHIAGRLITLIYALLKNEKLVQLSERARGLCNTDL